MGFEQIPEFKNKPTEPAKEKDGYIFENGIWRKRTKEEDIELIEKNNEEDKGAENEETKEIDENLRLIEQELKELESKEYTTPDDLQRKENLEIEYTKLDRQIRKDEKKDSEKEPKVKSKKEKADKGKKGKRKKEDLEKKDAWLEIEKIIQDPEALSKIFHEAFEISKNPEVQERFQGLKDAVEKIIKEKGEIPESVSKAAEHIKEEGKKDKDKKESPWGTAFGAAGWGILLFLVLFILAELKGIEALSGQATGKKKEKK